MSVPLKRVVLSTSALSDYGRTFHRGRAMRPPARSTPTLRPSAPKADRATVTTTSATPRSASLWFSASADAHRGGHSSDDSGGRDPRGKPLITTRSGGNASGGGSDDREGDGAGRSDGDDDDSSTTSDDPTTVTTIGSAPGGQTTTRPTTTTTRATTTTAVPRRRAGPRRRAVPRRRDRPTTTSRPTTTTTRATTTTTAAGTTTTTPRRPPPRATTTSTAATTTTTTRAAATIRLSQSFLRDHDRQPDSTQHVDLERRRDARVDHAHDRLVHHRRSARLSQPGDQAHVAVLFAVRDFKPQHHRDVHLHRIGARGDDGGGGDFERQHDHRHRRHPGQRDSDSRWRLNVGCLDLQLIVASTAQFRAMGTACEVIVVGGVPGLAERGHARCRRARASVESFPRRQRDQPA